MSERKPARTALLMSSALALSMIAASGAMAQGQEVQNPAAPSPAVPTADAPPGVVPTAPVETTPQQAPVTADVPARSSADTGLEEIVVTAQKRVENVQDVPKQIQVVTSALLKENNVTNLQDLRRLVPSFAGGGATAIRGVATGASSISANSKVGIVLDDVPIPSRASSAENLLDIERAEVLAGPQGTLAGRNATGGLINLVTRTPSLTDYHGTGVLQASDDREYIASAFITGPISETVAFSLSGNYQQFRGLAFNRFNDKWASSRTGTVRGKLLFQPSDDLRITLIGSYLNGRTTTAGTVFAFLGVPQTSIISTLDRQTPRRSLAELIPGTVPSFDNNSWYSPRMVRSPRQNATGILRVEKELGENNLLTFVGSILHEANDFYQDNTQQTFVNMEIRPERVADNDDKNWHNRTRYKTAELRLASTGDSPLTYIAGIFASDNDNVYDIRRYFQPVEWNRTFGQKNIAGYGSVSYTFPTGTTVRGGLRYEYDYIDYRWEFLAIGATSRVLENGITVNFPAVNPYRLSRSNASDDYVNFDAGIQQKIGEDIMLFATYAKANQGPVYDAEDNTIAIVRELDPVPSESVKSYEFGIKSQWFDRRLTVNVNYFHSLFDNYQAQTATVDPANPNAVPVLKLNAVGSVLTKGIEFNINASPFNGFRIGLNGTWNDAKIKDFPFAPCYTNQSLAGGCITAIPPGEFVARSYQTNLAGAPLASASKYRGNLNLAYSNELGFIDDVIWSAAVNIRYQSKQITNILQDPLTRRPALTFVTANFGLGRGPYKIDFAVNNLFKEGAETFGTALPSGFAAIPRAADGSSQVLTRTLSRENNRYFTVRLSATF